MPAAHVATGSGSDDGGGEAGFEHLFSVGFGLREGLHIGLVLKRTVIQRDRHLARML